MSKHLSIAYGTLDTVLEMFLNRRTESASTPIPICQQDDLLVFLCNTVTKIWDGLSCVEPDDLPGHLKLAQGDDIFLSFDDDRDGFILLPQFAKEDVKVL